MRWRLFFLIAYLLLTFTMVTTFKKCFIRRRNSLDCGFLFGVHIITLSLRSMRQIRDFRHELGGAVFSLHYSQNNTYGAGVILFFFFFMYYKTCLSWSNLKSFLVCSITHNRKIEWMNEWIYCSNWQFRHCYKKERLMAVYFLLSNTLKACIKSQVKQRKVQRTKQWARGFLVFWVCLLKGHHVQTDYFFLF